MKLSLIDAGEDVIISHLHEALPHRGLRPDGDGVEGPGPGEVQSVQVDHLTVCAVNHLGSNIIFMLLTTTGI